MPRPTKSQRRAEVLKTMDARLARAEGDNALLVEMLGGDGVADALRIMLDAPRRFIALQIDKLSK